MDSEPMKNGSGDGTVPGGTRAIQKPMNREQIASRLGIPREKLEAPAFAALYPFASRVQNFGSLGYHFIDEGAGDPVVMVHGNPTWSYFYRRLVVGLRSDYRCMVPDHMGCGLSDKPWKYTYDLGRHIANLEAWLEANLPSLESEGGKITLVVHDWGGPIGFGYAVRNPDRIRRIVVLNSSIFTAGAMPLRIRLSRAPLIGDLLVRGLNLFARLATTSTTVKPMPQHVRDGYLLPYSSWANRIGVNSFVKDIPLRKDTPTYKRLKRIEDMAKSALAGKPMLVQWGMKDWCFTPFFLDLWRKNFPKAEVDEYEAGHYILEDAGTDILGRIREFLRKPA